MIFNRSDSSFTARLYAGEPFTIEVQLSDEAGFIERLDGRIFEIRARDYHGNVVPGAVSAGAVGTDEKGYYVSGTLSGSQTALITATIEPSYELVEILANGEDVVVAGGLEIEARGASPVTEPSTTALGVTGRFTRTIARNVVRLALVQRGGRGFTPEERLAFTRDPSTGLPWIAEPTVPAMAAWQRAPALDAAADGAALINDAIADAGAQLNAALGDFEQVQVLANILIPSGATAILADSGNAIQIGDMM